MGDYLDDMAAAGDPEAIAFKELADLRAKLAQTQKDWRDDIERLQEGNRLITSQERALGDLRAKLQRATHIVRVLRRDMNPGDPFCVGVDEFLARQALEDECPAGGPHTLARDGSDECEECGARRPESASNPDEQGEG